MAAKEQTALVPGPPEWASRALQPMMAAIQDGRAELVLPALPVAASLATDYRAVASVVAIDPDPDAGDVFKSGSKKVGAEWLDLYSYRKPALERLAAAAGIQYRTHQMDDGRDTDYAAYEAIGGYTNESGQPVFKSAMKVIRLSKYREVRWKQVAAKNAASTKYRKSDEQLRSDFEAEMAQFEGSFRERCETGAALRLIRGLLAIKPALTAAQVARPKVVLRVTFSPDTSDPRVREFMLQQGMQAQRMLFGSVHAAPRALPPAAEPQRIESPPGDEALEIEEPEEIGNGHAFPTGDLFGGEPTEAPTYTPAELLERARKRVFAFCHEHGVDTMTKEERTKAFAPHLPKGYVAGSDLTAAEWDAIYDGLASMTPAKPPAEPDYVGLVIDGCRVLGLDQHEQRALFLKHKGDMKAAYNELQEKAAAEKAARP